MTSRQESNLSEFVRYARLATRDHSAWLTYEILAWVVLAIGLVTTYGLIHLNWMSALIGIGGLCLFGFLKDSSDRARVNTRDELVKDDRQPILYLRPFENDGADVSVDEGRIEIYSARQSDVTLARVLSAIGPLVCVGTPSEDRPPAGALRLYFNDNEWQEKVEALMQISRLVIIQPGYSSGLEWELETAKKILRPEQLIISLLDWRDMKRDRRINEYDIFNMQLHRIYGVSLPSYHFDAYFVYFDNQWRPHVAHLNDDLSIFLVLPSRVIGFIPNFQYTSRPAVRETIRPVLERAGIALSRWRTPVELGIAYCLSLLVLFYLLATLNALLSRG